MKTLWKWLLAVLVVLVAVVLLGLFGAPPVFAFRTYGMMAGWDMPVHSAGQGVWAPMLGGAFGWTKAGLVLGGIVQLGALGSGVLAIIWFLQGIGGSNKNDR